MTVVCIIQVVVLHFFNRMALEGHVKYVVGKNSYVVDFTKSASNIKNIDGDYSAYPVDKDMCTIVGKK